MTKYLAAYAAAIAVMLVLDVAWIGGVAKSVYQQGIGHLMAAKFNAAAAVAFYLVYGFGLMYFAVVPDGSTMPWGRTLLTGALFGLVAYVTYDLTNMATLRDWPLGMSLVDMAWGAFASMSAVAAGKLVFDRL